MTDGDTKKRYEFDSAYKVMSGEVERQLLKAPAVIRNYTSHLAKAKGKFIRAVALLTCSMDGENLIPEAAVTLATAVELLHLATLVHDDVIDDADLRRGVETLQKKFGKKAAVICGDYLLSMALRIAVSMDGREEYTNNMMPDYLSRICKGELLQEINNRNFALSPFRYLTIIKGKTAALFEASFYGGAVLSTKDKKQLQYYKRAGNYTGMIFQLMDDCMDYEMKQEHIGKNVQSDYEEGVVTLPLIYTMEQDPALKELVKQGRIEVEDICAAVHREGGTVYTRELAERYYKKAIDVIGKLDLSEMKRDKMTAVLNKSYYGAVSYKKLYT